MSNTGKCAIKMFKDLFNRGAELYQTAQQSNQQPQQRACLRVLRAEKLLALRLMEAEGNRGHDYTLPAQVKEQFQSMLEHYPSIRHVRDFIDIEQRLLASLKENLTSLPPSPLSLNLRTITTRHQQCLEKLGRELAGHPDK
tara:strand:+ start:362 stop:784 length:423 start_codon:yes stop_codon:yes gene_type:complete